MHNHDSAYWEQYYKFWDEFVGAWFSSMKSQKNIAEQIAMQFGNASCINLDELPEPYYGKPHEDVDAVFINLNPGMSTGNDLKSTKCFSKLTAPYTEGWLIKEFAKTKRYREYANECSCLDPNLRDHNPEVCGVKWWQDLAPKPIGGRMSWVRRIYGKKDMCPSKVFALELCPFHSKQWEFDFTGDKSGQKAPDDAAVDGKTAVSDVENLSRVLQIIIQGKQDIIEPGAHDCGKDPDDGQVIIITDLLACLFGPADGQEKGQ